MEINPSWNLFTTMAVLQLLVVLLEPPDEKSQTYCSKTTFEDIIL